MGGGNTFRRVLDPAKIFTNDPPPLIPAPVIQSPPVMPTPDDQTVKDAKKKSLQRQYQRRGRESTIMSDAVTGVETLGG